MKTTVKEFRYEPKRIVSFLKDNAVLMIAILAAIVTSIIVPPDKEYLGYFDFKTLACLFSVLAVVCALRNIRFFYTLAKAIVRKFRNARIAILALVYITFIGSMLIANDMALLDVYENALDKVHCFGISHNMFTVLVPMEQGKVVFVPSAGINVGCRQLVAHTFNSVFVGHHGHNAALRVVPIFDMVLVSALVVKPCLALSRSTAAGTDGRTVALIIFYALEELDRREFR